MMLNRTEILVTINILSKLSEQVVISGLNKRRGF